MTPSESTFWRFGLVPGFSGDRLGRCVEELVDGEQFAAGAGAAGPDPAGGPVAVVAPLFGEVAGVALVALVDGVLSARSGGGQGDVLGCRVAAAPGGLSAGVAAVAAAAGADGGGAADRAGDRLGIVTRRVARGGHLRGHNGLGGRRWSGGQCGGVAVAGGVVGGGLEPASVDDAGPGSGPSAVWAIVNLDFTRPVSSRTHTAWVFAAQSIPT